MDYRLCDRSTDPEGETDHLNVETLYRLPHSQWCYAPFYDIPLVDRPRDKVVFASFNQYTKISDPCLDLWCQILTRVPEASLAAYAIPAGKSQESLNTRLAARGIDPERVVIRDRLPVRDYLETIGTVGVALDTFPYNGATTTLDTLWMGVPVIALRGERSISRSSYSILCSMGASELIAETPEEYVELNVRLGHDAEWRRALRATLRDRLHASPLMDAAKFVADLEAGYRFMWRTWCETRPSTGASRVAT
jgi:predicted O-linked N-acetylglucosamine transferase (SPINDLY family)